MGETDWIRVGYGVLILQQSGSPPITSAVLKVRSYGDMEVHF